VAQAAKQDATGGSSVRGLPRRGNRVERAGRIAVDCSADKTSGEHKVCWWLGLPAKRDSIGRRCSQGSLVRATSTRWMPAGVNLTGWNGDKLSGRRGSNIFTSAAP